MLQSTSGAFGRMVNVNNNMYILGGGINVASRTLVAYNAATDTWDSLAGGFMLPSYIANFGAVVA